MFYSMLPNSYNKLSNYDFLPLDIRIPSGTSFTFGHKAPPGNPKILQSCNGLLLCFSLAYKELYVYNPCIYTMFKMIPQQRNVTFDKDYNVGGMRMAFDPTKSPHYKIIHAELMLSNALGFGVKIHTYSSQTGVWSVCGDWFFGQCFTCFQDRVYWNDAIHWVNHVSGQSLHFKLDILNERPVLKTLKTPLTLDRTGFHECKMFASCGCLLLVGKNDFDSRELYIYEMKNRSSEWSVKYIVNLDDITSPLPFRSISSNVGCIVLGEREDDSFMVMNCFEFIASLANILGSIIAVKAAFLFVYGFVYHSHRDRQALSDFRSGTIVPNCGTVAIRIVVDGLDVLKAIEKAGSSGRVTSNPDVVDK
ncbi:hypothetical protein Tco_1375823 [Tanacetum coccineum]